MIYHTAKNLHRNLGVSEWLAGGSEFWGSIRIRGI